MRKVIVIVGGSWVVFIYASYLYFWRVNVLWVSLGETFFRIFLLILFLLVNTALGRKVLGWLRVESESFLEQMLFSLGIGLAIFTYLLIGFGMVGIFNKWTMSLLLVGMYIFTYNEIKDIIHQLKNKAGNLVDLKMSFLETVLILILFIQIVFNLVGASVLPSEWDALGAHLSMAKEWARLHHLADISHVNLLSSAMPFNVGILYGMSLLVKDTILAKLVHFSFGVLIAIGIYSLGKSYFSRTTGLVSATIFYTIPIVGYVSTTAIADLGFTFYVFLAVYALINWIGSDKRGWLIVSAIIGGLALGSKYTGFLSVGILALGVLLYGLISKKKKLLGVASSFFLFTGLAASVGSFWYLRGFIISGHSVFGFLFRLLRGRLWSQAFAATRLEEIIDPGLDAVRSIPLIPWDISMHSGRFHGPGAIGVIFLAFLPFLLFGRLRRNRLIKFILYYSAIYFIFWVGVSPYKRGLIPILPLFGIMVAYIIDQLSNFNRILQRSFFALLILTFLFQIFYLAPQGLNKVYQRMLVFAGLKSQEEYILENEETYSVFKWVNENLPAEAKLYIINDPRTFYCDRSYVTVIPEKGTVHERLTQAGITHLVVNEELRRMGYGKATILTVLRAKHVRRYLKLLYDRDPFTVYQLLK